MPPPPEEIAQLMRFIAEKSKNVKSPMNIAELCKQFKEETGSSVTVRTLIKSIDTHRLKIHDMTEFDTETKVKMIFALSAPIYPGFLIELKKVADVKVDDLRRIIQYKQKDGKLELSEKHLGVLIPPEEIAQLMRFIAEKAKNVKSPMNISELCRQFKEETGSSVVLKTLYSRIERYRQKIHEMDEFDMELKVKLILALSAPIDAGFLVEMKKVADVEVDDQQRIVHYKQKDGTLELSAKYLQLSMDEGEQRGREFIQFLAEKSKTIDKPIADRVLMREFKEKSGYTDSIESLRQRYLRLKKTLFQLTEYDKNARIKMMFISHATLSYEIFQE